MINPHLSTGSIWRLRHGGREIARLTVTSTDMSWTRADVEALPGFEEFRPLFADHERAFREEDWELADACYARIRGELTLAFPDGRPVAGFIIRIRDDGTASWRWYDEPFDRIRGRR
ncbi:hypothetical protein [Streptomyces sp. NBC_01190]|uniref:hypothetical protein n=1 Tax=Streptomyces sp. NBC_01190 TaxID=2903767 RepID=UPI0038684B2F|nr:hypothetical protein OG519_19345 [Streptomyces sp. NBC_01190]